MTNGLAEGSSQGVVSGVGASRFRSPISTTFRRRDRSVTWQNQGKLYPTPRSRHPDPIDPHASIGRLIEAFDEVLDLGQHLLIPHGLGRLVDVHHHGPLEVGDGAGYCVYAVVVGERTAVFGEVGELVEKRTRRGEGDRCLRPADPTETLGAPPVSE
jgi:hypothetical protein